MRDEEESVRVDPHPGQRRRNHRVVADRGNDTAEDDGCEESAQPDAGQGEEDVVKDDVKKEQDVDDAAEDSVVSVDLLVGGGESPGVEVHGLEREEVLNGHLGDGNDAEAFGEMEEVYIWGREAVIRL